MRRLVHGRRPRSLAATGCLLLGAFVVAAPGRVAAQSVQGSTLSTAGGALLGVYSGAMFGLTGSLLPCDRTDLGSRCAWSGASAGGALGIAMGGLIGAQNKDALLVRLEHAGYGALIGAAVGVGLRAGVRQYQWGDVLAVSAMGAAVGTAPTGTLVGAAAGATVGSVAWLFFDGSGFPDFLMFTIAGSAVGGMVDWADGAATAKRTAGPRITSSFSLQVR